MVDTMGVPLLTTYATVKHVDVSLPLVAALLDGEKYMDPRDVRPLEGQELRRARTPSVRFLVKPAMPWHSPSNSASGCGAATSGSDSARARPRPKAPTTWREPQARTHKLLA
jgi:hypothetical protein